MPTAITERTIGMWSVALPNGDWLAHLARTDDGRCELTYRFRWYRDDKAFDSKDVKNWYKLLSKPGRDESYMLGRVRDAFEVMTKHGGFKGWELLRGARSVEEFIELLGTMPGIEMKFIKKENADDDAVAATDQAPDAAERG